MESRAGERIMAEATRCPACKAELPAGSPEGLFPKCLLKAGMAGESAPPVGATTDATLPPSPGAAEERLGSFQPPAPAELAGYFPQLEILELLGRGGMGAVYKARQPGLDRLVALKILPQGAGRDPAFAERFSREARSLARLSPPNIVTVNDCGKTGGLY